MQLKSKKFTLAREIPRTVLPWPKVGKDFWQVKSEDDLTLQCSLWEVHEQFKKKKQTISGHNLWFHSLSYEFKGRQLKDNHAKRQQAKIKIRLKKAV